MLCHRLQNVLINTSAAEPFIILKVDSPRVNIIELCAWIAEMWQKS